METSHVCGIAILAFVALPEFDSAHAGSLLLMLFTILLMDTDKRVVPLYRLFTVMDRKNLRRHMYCRAK